MNKDDEIAVLEQIIYSTYTVLLSNCIDIRQLQNQVWEQISANLPPTFLKAELKPHLSATLAEIIGHVQKT